MVRPAYTAPDGRPVPSVSDVLALCKSDWSSPLMDAAAQQGTRIHSLVAADALGITTPPLGSLPLGVRRGFEAWLAWRFDNDGRALAVERPIVSPLFGGTPDLVYETGGARVVIDLKATRARDYLHYAQVGAYATLWNHAHPEAPADRGLILRLDTSTGEPQAYWLDPDRLATAAAMFAALLGARSAREALKATEPRKRAGRAA